MRPLELQSHWEGEYPEIDVASPKIGILEQHGYSPEGYFVLPTHCWIENYYRSMQNRIGGFLERNKHGQDAKGLVAAEEQEIALYEKYNSFYSYGVYVARKLEAL